MPDHDRINKIQPRTGNPESRQFGSFWNSLKAAIVSTRPSFSENEDEERIKEVNRHYLSNVNVCVYEPSELRVLVTWPRAPMYLPVPPKTGRTTGLSASNSGVDGV